MDELLAAMYKMAVQLVPILGVAVLCFLIALIRHCIALIKELTETAKKAGTTNEKTTSDTTGGSASDTENKA